MRGFVNRKKTPEMAKKTWKRIKYQAVNRTERKSRDQVSRITATLPQPLATDYLLWGREGLIKYWPVKQVPCNTQEAQRKKICARYLALRFLFPAGRTRPAWCSWRRSRCCRECWPGPCPAGRSHHRSCRCRMQLRNGEHKSWLLWKKEHTHTEEPVMKHALQSHSVRSAAFSCVYVPQVFIAKGGV